MKIPIIVFVILSVMLIGVYASSGKENSQNKPPGFQRTADLAVVSYYTAASLRKGSVSGVGGRNSGRGGK